MKKILTVFLSAFLFFCTQTNLNADVNVKSETELKYAGLSEEHKRELIYANRYIESAINFSKLGKITTSQRDEIVGSYLARASGIWGSAVTTSTLSEIVSSFSETENTSLFEKIRGVVTLTNIAWVIGSLFLLLGTWHWVIRLFKVLLEIFVNIPVWVYEGLLYVASFGLMAVGQWYFVNIADKVAFAGCLLFGIALAFSNAIGKRAFDKLSFSLSLFFVWSIVAVAYNSSLVGFIAVAALMSALGFSMLVLPGVVCVGFDDEDSLGRTTAAAFYVALAFVAIKITGVGGSVVLSPFEYGCVNLGSFVGFLGLLISSNKWYNASNYGRYIFAQIIFAVVATLGITIGSVWNITALRECAVSFLVLYILTKPWEIPVESRDGFAVLCLFFGLLLYAFVWFVNNNMALVSPYLLLI